ncbi:DUF3575 domain-containing protein [Aquimarina sp. ERC-38]|uniref:DUF3575 domain-containing protein n=1 Tax=Aquimarina sp. ERC-38 TaxID=2949996 RepID=UPI00224767A4|nr:DUF3575 domain-containing protein [Aquimarina sp. ERC-38]UZO80832.1 DUF3575 domain-containing protein [Aquimarina sp. ERC-38]
MKLIWAIITCLTVACIPLSAQDVHVEKHQFKANLLFTPSLDYEIGISNNSTLGFNLGTGLIYTTGDFRGEAYGIFLTFSPYYRYYYNFKRRIRKGKNINQNSANYVGITSSIVPGTVVIGNIDISENYVAQIGAVYGFQRTYWKRLNLGLDFGVGYAFSNLGHSVVPILNFNLGYVFSTNKNS